MRYAKIRKMDISNGPGIRVSLFVQGCTFHCPNCFNPETHDFDGGKEFTEDTLKEILDFWIEFFGNFNLNEKRLIIALFIDIIFRLDNSTIEESDFTRTNRWINILNEIFYRKNKLKFLE